MARSMLKEKNVSKQFWGEAVTTTIYLLNKSRTKRLDKLTPKEVWSRVKPRVSHLRVFGSPCYKHVPDQKRKKLDDKGEVMVLIGYHPTGAYKLWNPCVNKVEFSRDVIVDETEVFQWKALEYKSSKTVPIELCDNSSGDTAAGESSSSRPQRLWQQSTRLAGFELHPDSTITDDGELVYYALQVESEPVTFEQAIREAVWRDAIEKELAAIKGNETWELVKVLVGKKPISVRWVFKIKRKPDGSVAKFKARLVARGFLQKLGVNFQEVFAPVARIETIRIVAALAVHREWSLYQLDVKSAFLNGELEEEVYITQLPGFEIPGSEHLSLRLKKALYGLR